MKENKLETELWELEINVSELKTNLERLATEMRERAAAYMNEEFSVEDLYLVNRHANDLFEFAAEILKLTE
jgi:hypothetical protein